MHRCDRNGVLALTVTLCALEAHTAARAASQGLAAADELFAAGRLAESLAAYERVLASDPDDSRALLQTGRLLLWRGRLSEAGDLLGRVSLRDDAERAELLLQLAYRRDDFAAAARHARTLDLPARAAQLAHLAAGGAYRTSGATETALPFVQTDPLPFVELAVNGSEPGLFLIDTGGGELILDPEVAARVGATTFGSRTGTFAADQTAEVELAAVDDVRLGEILVRGVPVRLLDMSRFSALTGGRRVDGILGTLLLTRFEFTLDYPGGRLVLRPRDGAAPADEGTERIPYWLAGDHLILAEGAVNDAPPHLVLVDTGLAGGGFAAPDSTLTAAGIALQAAAVEGEGGGGRVRATPVVAERLRLGGVDGYSVPGFAGVFPPSLERKLGCRIGALFSHGFLRPYSVTFDPVLSEIRLVRP